MRLTLWIKAEMGKRKGSPPDTTFVHPRDEFHLERAREILAAYDHARMARRRS